MAYIGKQPLVGNYISCDSLSASATTTYNLASSGTPVFPTVPQNCIVSLNGVVQAPVTSFTISGSTIIFSTTLSTTDSIDYITVLGSTLNIGTPSNNTVGLSQLSATGTPSSTTFLRGDNSWAAATDLVWQSVQTTSFTAVAGRAYPVNTTSASITVTLPATPVAGNQVQIVDYAGTADTNAIVINPNSNKLEGGTGNLQLGGDREGVILTYIDSTQGWIPTSGINEGTDALTTSYSIDFLVVAGGGSGGGNVGTQGGCGGGGAGGYRTSTQSVSIGTVITVTVGDGGATKSGAGTGNNGSNSSISGSGLTTITSAGGGAGAGATVNANSGGSGGGANGEGPSLKGSGNTPSTSPSQGNDGGTSAVNSGSYGGGGGGGAGAVGVNGTTSAGGNGGTGTASSITGSSVTRGGGGGGSTYTGGTAGTGGTGGGGNGCVGTGTPTSGTANSGGGEEVLVDSREVVLSHLVQVEKELLY